MMANTPTSASEDRPAPARRRASRSFAPTPFALEGRELLATSNVTYLPVGTAPPLGPVSVTTTVLPLPPDSIGLAPVFGAPQAGGVLIGPQPAPPASPGPPPTSGPPRPPHDWPKFRLAMAEADVQVDGKWTPEFALAAQGWGKVLVKVGLGGPLTVLSAAQGINKPGAVVLADVNGDGLPDLVVANTGGNNVLVFPGLPGGGVGPERNGGRGFAVGQQPAGITVCDLSNDGGHDLIVANKGSNDVTILDGRGTGANWTLSLDQTLAAGTSPVRTALQDINLDGKPDLFILNSGSNDVTMYPGLGDGKFDTEAAARFAVGQAPSEMFIGRFDHRPGLDLVTVNAGSDNVSFIAGISTGSPQTMTFTSGGSQPDAAFAADLNHDGVLDLVVANGGDGRLALLQGAGTGLQLTEVIMRPGLPAPTALAPEFVTGAGLDFFAASGGQDAAQLLQFDLGPASAFLSLPLETSGWRDDTESELVSQLLPFEKSDLDLIAVLWESERVSRTKTSDFEDREATSSPVPLAKTDQEEDAGGTSAGDPANPSPIALPPDDPASWIRFVLGIDLALNQPRNLLLTLAPIDDEAADLRPPALPLPGRPPADPDLEAAADTIDEALRSLDSEAPAPTDPAPDPTGDPGRPGPGPVDAPPRAVRVRSIPAVATSILLATRLILKASPPRPPSTRRGVARRLEEAGPHRDRPTRL